jgi:uncharacterized membrane protein
METNSPFKTADSGKNAAIVSYITLIGWLIAYFGMYKDNKTALSTYHLRQSLLLHLTFIVINIALTIVVRITLSLTIANLGWLVYVAYIVFVVLGVISANNEEKKPLPLLGEKAQTMFPGI